MVSKAQTSFIHSEPHICMYRKHCSYILVIVKVCKGQSSLARRLIMMMVISIIRLVMIVMIMISSGIIKL